VLPSNSAVMSRPAFRLVKGKAALGWLCQIPYALLWNIPKVPRNFRVGDKKTRVGRVSGDISIFSAMSAASVMLTVNQ